MYICVCNPFTDKDVREFLSGKQEKVKVIETYRACSGGESPECCTCMNELRDMVREHNHEITIRCMEKDLTTEKA